MSNASAPGIGERVRRYLSGADLDEPHPADEAAVIRLPEPLPIAVRRLAMMQLIVLGALVLTVAAALAIGGIAVVIMPFALGRQGVGMSMVSLFGLCLTAVLTTLPFFAARGAARILRRDARGVAPVNRFAWLTILLAIPLGFAGTLGIDVVSPGDAASGQLSLPSKLFLTVLTLCVLLSLWAVTVLRRYKRVLPPDMF